MVQAPHAEQPAEGKSPVKTGFPLFEPVTGASTWQGDDLRNPAGWLTRLSSEHLTEVDKSVRQLHNTPEEELHLLTAEDYKWPTLRVLLQGLRDEVNIGRGFAIVRGLPAEKYSLKELIIAYWGIACHLGKVQPTNRFGHLIGHVKDHGRDPDHPLTRLYSTNAAQPFHCDRAADIIGLCCVRQAKAGGLSSWTSSHTVINEMLRSRPDFVQALMQPMPTDRKGEVPEGKGPWYPMAVVHSHHGGHLTVNYGGPFIKGAQQAHPAAPRLTQLQRDAMQFLEDTAAREDLRLDFDLAPGDMQFINNHTILHARSAFQDWQDEGLRRHLLRTWIAPPDGRPLPAAFAEQWASMTPGDRGGIRVPDAQPHISVAANA